jgi:hypothetical protein
VTDPKDAARPLAGSGADFAAASTFMLAAVFGSFFEPFFLVDPANWFV